MPLPPIKSTQNKRNKETYPRVFIYLMQQDISLFSAVDRDMVYDTSVVVSYATTTEYRSCLRKLFNMVNVRGGEEDAVDETEDDDDDDDAETRDENDYDESMCCKMMDFIYLHTKEDPVLLDLYERAAATMMSVDCEIGLVVLFSYDYFHMFHLVLCDYFSAVAAAAAEDSVAAAVEDSVAVFGAGNEHVVALIKGFEK